MKGMVGWLVSLNFAQKKLFLLFEFPAERFGLYNGSYKKADFFLPHLLKVTQLAAQF